jgi:CheY-like chemotaxis protein
MGQTILVADDSKTIRTIFEWVFKGSPYQAQIVEGGAEVFAALQRVQPSLIVLDYNMADREGYDVCQVLKSNPQTSSIPVLMVGGKFAEFSEERASASGADDFIMKPFRTDALMKKVDALLSKGATGDVKQLAAAPRAAAPSAPAAAPPAAPPAAPGRPRFPFPGQQAPAAPPAAPPASRFSMDKPTEASQAHTPQPSPISASAGAAASLDPAALREEVQASVKDLLPNIVRGVLKELISKEVMPGLQQWVEKRLDTLVEQKVQAEIERLRRGG